MLVEQNLQYVAMHFLDHSFYPPTQSNEEEIHYPTGEPIHFAEKYPLYLSIVYFTTKERPKSSGLSGHLRAGSQIFRRNSLIGAKPPPYMGCITATPKEPKAHNDSKCSNLLTFRS